MSLVLILVAIVADGGKRPARAVCPSTIRLGSVDRGGDDGPGRGGRAGRGGPGTGAAAGAPLRLLPFTVMGGSPVLAVDALSAFFLVPVFLMGGLGSIYGLGYWPQRRHLRTGTKLRLFWGLLVAGMALLVISRNGLVFLLGWEVMALSAFFLVSTEDHRAQCREAGWIYLIATHIGTLTLFALFALWRWATGSYELVPAAIDTMSAGVKNGLFFLALLGFGLKAGHDAAAFLAARRRTPTRPATSRRCSRAWCSRWASTGWSGCSRCCPARRRPGAG